ncbi:DUF6389 family protein [Streptomyces rubiginosohelvolus]|uniref:DUF6389 family protein n=1 Tax=Streptomyces rubiginosohelvolus TaxID=67362 RepID=UPI003416BCFE
MGDERQLFTVVWAEHSWEPAVPERPGAWSTARFEDVLFATVVEWIDPLIPPDAVHLQWEVTAPDGTQDCHPVGPGR